MYSQWEVTMKIELSRLDELLVAVIDRHTEYVNATPDSDDEHGWYTPCCTL